MEVFDWDMVGSDDFIGMISEPLLSAQTKSEEVIRKVLVNDERKFKREACVKFKLRWLPEDYDEAQEAIQRGSRKSLDSNQRSSGCLLMMTVYLRRYPEARGPGSASAASLVRILPLRKPARP